MATTSNPEERTLRGFAPTILAVLLIAFAGCENRPPEETRVAEAPPPSAPAGPRVNLYPLTTPPPGSLQPLTGSAPLAYAPPTYAAAPEPVPAAGFPQSPYRTVPAATYAPTYAPAPAAVSYAPPMPGSYSASYTTTYRTPEAGMTTAGGYCMVEEITASSSPFVPMPDPPVVVENRYYPSGPPAATYSAPYYTPAAGSGYTTTATTYTTAPVSYSSGVPAPAPAYVAPVAVVPATTTTYVATTAAPATAQAGVTGFRLIPAPDVPPGIHPNDAAPSQWFEIVRPGNGPIRIGRVTSTCVCVGVRVPNRYIGAGERALVEARILTRPPVNNLTYGIYVNLLEPEKVVVDADVTIRL